MISLVKRWLDNFDPQRKNFETYSTLVVEELKEFDAEPDDLKEACDLIWVAVGKGLQKFSAEQLEQGLIAVYESNMSKACSDESELKEWLRKQGMSEGTTITKLPNGQVVALRADGKILKGPAYKPASV